MKKAILLIFSIGLLGFYAQVAQACSCLETKSDKKEKADYKRWLKAFDGAVFSGKVVKIERIQSSYQMKVTFKVDRYWKGVDGLEATIETAMDGAACGVHYIEGNQYFVIANRSGEKLSTDLCSWLGYSKNEKAYLKGLGSGKIPKTPSM
jgi:hypothetical protein